MEKDGAEIPLQWDTAQVLHKKIPQLSLHECIFSIHKQLTFRLHAVASSGSSLHAFSNVLLLT